MPRSSDCAARLVEHMAEGAIDGPEELPLRGLDQEDAAADRRWASTQAAEPPPAMT